MKRTRKFVLVTEGRFIVTILFPSIVYSVRHLICTSGGMAFHCFVYCENIVRKETYNIKLGHKNGGLSQ
jgi:hypothetical protein